jgi:hypothetical protein
VNCEFRAPHLPIRLMGCPEARRLLRQSSTKCLGRSLWLS